MYTILEESSFGKSLKSYRTLRWRSSNNLPNTLTETFWHVRTNFRLHTFLKYLKIKSITEGLPLIETRLLIDFPGTLKDDLYLSALMAKDSDVPIDILMKRIRHLQGLLQSPLWGEGLLNTYSNCVSYEIMETRRTIRKVKKYSGYVRNPSSVGSKRNSSKVKPLPETFEWNSYEGIDFYEFLTVGKFSGICLEMFYPDDDEIKSKR